MRVPGPISPVARAPVITWLRAVLASGLTQTLLAMVAAILLWEVAVAVFDVRAYILPAPSKVLQAAIRFQAQLLGAAAYTVQSMLVGYLLAVVSGVLLAVPVAFSPFMQRTVYPLLVISQLVPKVALAPLFVIWFGFGLTPKIMIVFLLSFFAIVLNGIVGLRSLDPDVVNLTRSTGARALDVFFKVRLPSALPYFFAGFKLAAVSAAIGAVIGEFIGSDGGLGYIILTANGALRTDYSFAAIAAITLLGLALYYTVELLERLLVPWHVSQRGGEG
jgi:NitT/TauT family transport system permease protein